MHPILVEFTLKDDLTPFFLNINMIEYVVKIVGETGSIISHNDKIIRVVEDPYTVVQRVDLAITQHIERRQP
jgi:hypothetical protein